MEWQRLATKALLSKGLTVPTEVLPVKTKILSFRVLSQQRPTVLNKEETQVGCVSEVLREEKKTLGDEIINCTQGSPEDRPS